MLILHISEELTLVGQTKISSLKPQRNQENACVNAPNRINTWCIDTSASTAKSRISLALVDVHTDLHQRGRLEAGVALAREAAGDVDAGAVSAHAVHDGALIDVHAPDIVLVQGVTLCTKIQMTSHKNDF